MQATMKAARARSKIELVDTKSGEQGSVGPGDPSDGNVYVPLEEGAQTSESSSAPASPSRPGTADRRATKKSAEEITEMRRVLQQKRLEYEKQTAVLFERVYPPDDPVREAEYNEYLRAVNEIFLEGYTGRVSESIAKAREEALRREEEKSKLEKRQGLNRQRELRNQLALASEARKAAERLERERVNRAEDAVPAAGAPSQSRAATPLVSIPAPEKSPASHASAVRLVQSATTPPREDPAPSLTVNNPLRIDAMEEGFPSHFHDIAQRLEEERMALEYTQHRMQSDLRADCSSDDDEEKAQRARLTIREQVAAIKERLFNATAQMSNREVPSQTYHTTQGGTNMQHQRRKAELSSVPGRGSSPHSSAASLQGPRERARHASESARLTPRVSSATHRISEFENAYVHNRTSRSTFALEEQMTRASSRTGRVLSAKPRSSLLEANRQNVVPRDERARRRGNDVDYARHHVQVVHSEYPDPCAFPVPGDPVSQGYTRIRSVSRQERTRGGAQTPLLPVLQGRAQVGRAVDAEVAPVAGLLSVVGAAAPRK